MYTHLTISFLNVLFISFILDSFIYSNLLLMFCYVNKRQKVRQIYINLIINKNKKHLFIRNVRDLNIES